METWTDDLAGGILFQDDPYPFHPAQTVHPADHRVLQQAQDRFLNMTYRSPSVIKTPERLLHRSSVQAPKMIISGTGSGGLTRGLSLGELSPRTPNRDLLTPLEFDTKKVATHGTLKRLKLVKSPTDTQLFVPNQVHQQFDPSSGNFNFS